MSELVDRSTIEGIVGAKRSQTEHLGRAVSAEHQVYILHSRDCIEAVTARGSDLRACPFSTALDSGIDGEAWREYQDIVVTLTVDDGDLVPIFEEGRRS